MKIRRLADNRVIVGFAGSSADAFALLEAIRGEAEGFSGEPCPAPPPSWPRNGRTDRVLRRLEIAAGVADSRNTLLISGTGDVITPTDGIWASAPAGTMRCRGPSLGGPFVALRRRDRAPIARNRFRDRYLHEHEHRRRGDAMRELRRCEEWGQAPRKRFVFQHTLPGARSQSPSSREEMPCAS